jgi:hypothetical protein
MEINGDCKMRRQIAVVMYTVVFCSAVSCSAVLGLVASSSFTLAQQEAAKTDHQVYSSIKDLMESIIDPSADVVWGAVGTVVDREGIHESLPKTQEDWRDLRRAAVRIIEGGNLLTMPGRDAAPVGAKSEAPGVELEPPQIAALIEQNRETFDTFAKALQVLGSEALRASEARNAALLLDIGARMENVCESCHQTFWYPPGKPTTP